MNCVTDDVLRYLWCVCMSSTSFTPGSKICDLKQVSWTEVYVLPITQFLCANQLFCCCLCLLGRSLLLRRCSPTGSPSCFTSSSRWNCNTDTNVNTHSFWSNSRTGVWQLKRVSNTHTVTAAVLDKAQAAGYIYLTSAFYVGNSLNWGSLKLIMLLWSLQACPLFLYEFMCLHLPLKRLFKCRF